MGGGKKERYKIPKKNEWPLVLIIYIGDIPSKGEEI